MNVYSGQQKEENCGIKEPEAAIKYHKNGETAKALNSKALEQDNSCRKAVSNVIRDMST